MDKIEFDKMSGKNKKLYEALWKESDFSFGDVLEHTWYKNKFSSNSYSFSQASLLIDIFEIKGKYLFRKKYSMAISGSGGEDNKINTLHSSSLCALLHFYNVTEKNPLTIELKTHNNNDLPRKVKFTKSVFEFKSPVIGSPSNMDVVLSGVDVDSKENVVLFLESKFSEYLDAGKSSGISKDYLKNKYTEKLYKGLGELGLKTEDNKKNPDSKFDMVVKEGEKLFYIEGIKQMISHYCGIRNIIDGNYYDKEADEFRQTEIQDVVEGKIKNGAVVILGEIIFDFTDALKRRDEEKDAEKYEALKSRYAEKYKVLAEKMFNERCEQIHVLDKLLTYNEIFKNEKTSYNLPPRIKAFYYNNESD
ncbi:hypothetical protein [Anaerovibrio sp. RM50]|uniref:hypothetical protein n=1 Tax=Anaerovibrio sp. RM50 TaxID=1200557 RepID=UPI0004830CE3|nr:hypothetical protein [Anaerovibrio sp. RM50]